MAKGVIVACDVGTLQELEDVAVATRQVKGVAGYKIGAVLGCRYGLTDTVEVIDRSVRGWGHQCFVLYDHQKAGTDIPPLGSQLADVWKCAGVDGVIIFPLSGPETQTAWTEALKKQGLGAVVGGHMTHPRFLVSEGGYIADDAPERIFRLAIEQGVNKFVVPGNKPEFVERYRKLFETKLGQGKFTLMAPGFITQGGDISETGKVAGDNWYAIVGSAIYKAGGIPEMRQAANQIVSQIT